MQHQRESPVHGDGKFGVIGEDRQLLTGQIGPHAIAAQREALVATLGRITVLHLRPSRPAQTAQQLVLVRRMGSLVGGQLAATDTLLHQAVVLGAASDMAALESVPPTIADVRPEGVTPLQQQDNHGRVR